MDNQKKWGWIAVPFLLGALIFVWLGPPSCRQGSGVRLGGDPVIRVGGESSVNLADFGNDLDQIWKEYDDKIVRVSSDSFRLTGSFGSVHKIPEPLFGGNGVQVRLTGNGEATVTLPEPGRYWVADTSYDIANNNWCYWAVLVEYK